MATSAIQAAESAWLACLSQQRVICAENLPIAASTRTNTCTPKRLMPSVLVLSTSLLPLLPPTRDFQIFQIQRRRERGKGFNRPFALPDKPPKMNQGSNCPRSDEYACPPNACSAIRYRRRLLHKSRELTRSGGLSPKECWKALWRRYWELARAPGNYPRVAVPHCIRDFIRALHPDPRGNYAVPDGQTHLFHA